MAMESFCFVDSENCEPGGKMSEEKLPKKTSLGSAVRRKLSDITNSQQHFKSPNSQDDKLKRNSIMAKDYIEQLQKENMALRQLLQERNKLIELTGVELTKMRINMQKLQQQNRLLAQANSQMTMERSLDKDRLKTLHHEVACRGALIAAKDLELQEKMKIKPSQKHCTAKKVKGKPEEDGGGDNKPCNLNQRRQSRIQSLESSTVEEQVEAKEGTNRKRQSRRTQSLGISALEEQRETKEMADDESEEVGGTVPANGGDNKPCKLNRSRRPRTQSLGCSALQDQVTAKEKPDDKRQSARFKSEREPTDEKSDNKRLCLRRQSARFQSEQMEPTDDLFEIEDTILPIRPISTSVDKNMQDGASSSSTTEMKERKYGQSCDDTPALRTSIGRPLRRAAEKVVSYKEVPVNIKMRRPE